MSLPEFLLFEGELEKGGFLLLKGAEHRHLALSRRIKRGQLVRIGDGRGLVALCRVDEIGQDETRLEIKELLEPERDTLPICMILSLIKKERMDWAVQKLAEIGVETIQPVISERSVARSTGSRAERRRKRWQKIALEALKQSRGALATRIEPIRTLKELLIAMEERAESRASIGPLLVLHMSEEARPLHEVLSSFFGSVKDEKFEAVNVVIGPEGGFSEEEIRLFKGAGALFSSLGRRILRSETAAVAAASTVLSIYSATFSSKS